MSGKASFMGIRMSGRVAAHTISPEDFDSQEKALEAALEWAEDNGVEVLYVERQ
jgi:hypothetical protein